MCIRKKKMIGLGATAPLNLFVTVAFVLPSCRGIMDPEFANGASRLELVSKEFDELGSLTGVRSMMNFSGVDTFERCYAFFSSSTTKTEAEEAAALRMVATHLNSTVNTARMITAAALHACSSGSSIAACRQLATSDREKFENGSLSEEVFEQWIASGCGRPLPRSKAISLAALDGEIDVAARRQIRCLELVKQLIGEARNIIRHACSVTGHVGDDNLDRICASDFTDKLVGLKRRVRFQVGLELLATEMELTIAKLSGMHDQLANTLVRALGQSGYSSGPSFALESRSVLSHALFPSGSVTCKSAQLCASSCHNLRNALDLLGRFVAFKKTASLELLAKATEATCKRENASRTDACLRIDHKPHGIRCVLALQKRAGASLKVCNNLRCHFPLMKTEDERHWEPSLLAFGATLRMGAAQLFPNSTRSGGVGTILPCGLACSASLQYKTGSHNSFRWTIVSVGIPVLFMNILGIIAFFLNRHRLRRPSRRLLVLLNFAFIIGPGTDALLSANTAANRMVSCFGDGTLRITEPSEHPSLCAFVAWKITFGFLFMCSIAVAISHEWYHLVRTLKIPTSKGSRETEKRRVGLNVLLGLAYSGFFSAIPLLRKSVVGFPSQSTCFLSPKDAFFFFALPLAVMECGMMAHLLYGLPPLLATYKGLSGYADHVKQLLRSAVQMPKNKQKKRGGLFSLEMTILMFLVYITYMIFSLVIILPFFGYIYAVESRMAKSVSKYVECAMLSCDIATCPHWEQLSPAFIILADLSGQIFGIIISLWVMQYSKFWRPHVQPCCGVLSRKQLQNSSEGSLGAKHGCTGSSSTSKKFTVQINLPDLPRNGAVEHKSCQSERRLGHDVTINDYSYIPSCSTEECFNLRVL